MGLTTNKELIHDIYKILFQKADENILIVNKNGKILDVNDNICQLFGYSKEQFLKIVFDDIPEKTKVSNQQFINTLQGLLTNEEGRFVGSLSRKDGSSFIAEVKSRTFSFNSQEIYRITISDISGKMNEIVGEGIISGAEQENLNRLLFESALDAILIMDDEKFLYCNASALRAFRCKDYNELIYHSPWEFSPHKQPDGNDSMLKAKLLINDAIAGKPQHFDWMHLCKDGTRMEAEVSLNAIHFKGEQYIQAIVRDVTRRNQAERQIKDSEARFKSLFNNINAGLALHEVVLDESGKPEDFIFLDVNPVYEEITKLKAKDIIGKRGKEVIPALEQKWIDIYGRVAITGEPVSLKDHSNYLDKWWDVKAFSPKKGLFAVVLTDITASKITQLKLEKNKESMQQAEEIAGLGYYERNWKTGEGYWSDGFYKLLGLEPKSGTLSHDKVRKFVHKDDLESITGIIDHALQNKQDIDNLNFRFVRKNGTVIHVHGVGKSRYDDTGKLLSTSGVFKDVTLTKKAQNIVEKFFEQTMNLHIIVDFEGRIQKVNEGWKTILGYEPSALVGQKIYKFVHPGDLESTEKEMKSLASGNTTKYFENRYRHFSGNYKHLAWSAVISTEEKLVFAVASDITEQQKAREKLKAQNQRYATLISNLSGMVYRCRNDHDWTMEFISKGCHELTGYKPEHLISNKLISYNDLILPKYQDATWEAWQKALSKQEPVELEYEIQTASGEIKWVWERGCGIFGEQGQLLHLEGIVTDITKRKMAEARAEKLSKAVEQSPESIIITDRSGIIEYVNPRFTELTGYTTDETIGQNPRILQSGYHDRNFYKDIWDTILEGNIWINEMKNKKKNGELYWERVIISPIFGINKEITHFVAVKEDITRDKALLNQLREAKQKAEENEKQFQKLFENMEQGFALHKMIYDDQGNPVDYRFILINKAFEKLTRMKAKKYVGKTVLEMLPRTEKTWIENYGKVASTGEPMHFENYSQEFNRYYDVMAYSPQQDYFAVIFTDVTKNRLFQKQLIEAKEIAEENEKNFRLLADSAKVAISIIAGADGSDYLYVNDHWIKTTGYDPENLSGIKPTDIIHPDMVETVVKYAENRLKGLKAPERYELKIITRQGEIKYLDFTSVPIKYGTRTALLTAGLDITEKKLTEERLKSMNAELITAKEKAEESDRLKSAFLANMSHEIRTPMNGILGFSTLLKEPDLSGKQKLKYIEVIEQSGERMLNIINDLIDISKIEAGQAEIVNSLVDIRQQADYIATFFKPETNAKGLELISRFPDRQIEPVFTDKVKLVAILSNLLKNAIKYTARGKIIFGYDYITLKDDIPGLRFYVEDTGIGIPENRIEAIFERFVQADIEDSKALEGAGLGLAISKAYAGMLGGDITVESMEGKGSTFVFTLPLNQQKPANITEQPGKQPDNHPGEKKLKILIAEDDENSEVHLSIVVRKLAGSLLHTSNGIETVEICRNNPDIDLVLMDIKMPGIDGYEATRRIREFNQQVVIIAQTAYALSGDRQKAIDAGCNDYISKPIQRDKLTGMIKKFFKQ